MKILFHHNFDKEYAKLSEGTKARFKERLSIFMDDSFDPILRNHALVGKYHGYRSINVDGDFRAVYKLMKEGVFLFVAIGTHSKLYGS